VKFNQISNKKYFKKAIIMMYFKNKIAILFSVFSMIQVFKHLIELQYFMSSSGFYYGEFNNKLVF